MLRGICFAVLRCVVEWSLSVTSTGIKTSAPIDEKGTSLQITIQSCMVKRCAPIVVRHVHVPSNRQLAFQVIDVSKGSGLVDVGGGGVDKEGRARLSPRIALPFARDG